MILEIVSIFDVVDPKLKLNIDLFFENRKQEHPKMCYFKANIILQTFLKTRNQNNLKNCNIFLTKFKNILKMKKEYFIKNFNIKRRFFLST